MKAGNPRRFCFGVALKEQRDAQCRLVYSRHLHLRLPSPIGTFPRRRHSYNGEEMDKHRLLKAVKDDVTKTAKVKKTE